MAKKKRQVRRTTAPTTGTEPKSTRAFDREFNPDYSPVIKDLKRIGALAGTFFVILVVLSFILR